MPEAPQLETPRRLERPSQRGSADGCHPLRILLPTLMCIAPSAVSSRAASGCARVGTKRPLSILLSMTEVPMRSPSLKISVLFSLFAFAGCSEGNSGSPLQDMAQTGGSTAVGSGGSELTGTGGASSSSGGAQPTGGAPTGGPGIGGATLGTGGGTTH